MLRFDQYISEEQAKKEMLLQAINGHEDRLMEVFIQQGPDELRKQLKVRDDFTWSTIFDHLVFSKDILKRCVMFFLPFFKNLVREQGPAALRRVFGLDNAMYDSVFESLFDFIVVANGALFEYVHEQTSCLVTMIKQGRGNEIRSLLCLDKPKYDTLWKDVLDFLCHSYSRQLIHEADYELNMRLLSLWQHLL